MREYPRFLPSGKYYKAWCIQRKNRQDRQDRQSEWRQDCQDCGVKSYPDSTGCGRREPYPCRLTGKTRYEAYISQLPTCLKNSCFREKSFRFSKIYIVVVDGLFFLREWQGHAFECPDHLLFNEYRTLQKYFFPNQNEQIRQIFIAGKN